MLDVCAVFHAWTANLLKEKPEFIERSRTRDGRSPTRPEHVTCATPGALRFPVLATNNQDSSTTTLLLLLI